MLKNIKFGLLFLSFLVNWNTLANFYQNQIDQGFSEEIDSDEEWISDEESLINTPLRPSLHTRLKNELLEFERKEKAIENLSDSDEINLTQSGILKDKLSPQKSVEEPFEENLFIELDSNNIKKPRRIRSR